MADSKRKRGKSDRSRVAGKQRTEVSYVARSALDTMLSSKGMWQRWHGTSPAAKGPLSHSL